MNNYVRTPIGLEPLVFKIEDICSNSDVFHRCGIKPNHYLINLDAGNGQSTVATYISDAFRAYGIRHFGGLDLFLEYTLDGSMAQLKQVLSDIRACAVYTNNYEGVVAMDISALAAHLNETQISVFLKELPVIGEHATLILYVPSVINRNMALLIDKVHTALGDDLEFVKIDAYTELNLVGIIKSLIDESGVNLSDETAIDSCLLNIIRSTDTVNIRDAKQLVHIMIKNANFDNFVPELNSDLINAAFGISATKKEVK